MGICKTILGLIRHISNRKWRVYFCLKVSKYLRSASVPAHQRCSSLSANLFRPTLRKNCKLNKRSKIAKVSFIILGGSSSWVTTKPVTWASSALKFLRAIRIASRFTSENGWPSPHLIYVQERFVLLNEENTRFNSTVMSSLKDFHKLLKNPVVSSCE